MLNTMNIISNYQDSEFSFKEIQKNWRTWSGRNSIWQWQWSCLGYYRKCEHIWRSFFWNNQCRRSIKSPYGYQRLGRWIRNFCTFKISDQTAKTFIFTNINPSSTPNWRLLNYWSPLSYDVTPLTPLLYILPFVSSCLRSCV